MKRHCSHALAMIAAATCASGASAVEVDAAAVDRARQAFVERMAAEHGFEVDSLAALLDQAKIEESVLQAMSRPAERVLAWHEYRALFLTDARIGRGVEFWRTHEQEVDRVAARYQVAPEMLVAILGIESLFGERTGRYRVLDSLATLAFAYPPRARFFTSELEAFLLLAREEAVDPLQALGSYAGAMGAGQFIPSSYRAYAVDGDGDGRRDLWGSWEDVLGSVANYFSEHGWKEGEPVVERATLSEAWSGHQPANGLDLTETVASLSTLGYVFPSTQPDTAPATILSLEGKDAQEYWVGFHNFRVITRYNRSVMYALAAHQLGEAIRAALEQGNDRRG
jgi:membrane-bound lytic murein transglycosylase B